MAKKTKPPQRPSQSAAEAASRRKAPPTILDGTLLAPPRGMRDIVPPTSTGLKRLRSSIMRGFALYGYERVTTPPFELAEVLERGLDVVDRRELMRFVEPHTGEVALLRPDITPQIARIVATRLQDRPAPHRICYEGTVVRRMRQRGRRRQQTLQAGVECIGLPGPDADVEVVRVVDHVCRDIGLSGHQLELAHVNIAATLLDGLPAAARVAVAEALAQKDGHTVEARLSEAGVPARERKRFLALTELYGGIDVLSVARKRFRSGPIADALAELTDVIERLSDVGLAGELVLDLGELRGHSYYTGVSVTLLAEGPGAPIGTGGRYDGLLGRFGAPAPATGFAFDVDNLAWALDEQGIDFMTGAPARVVVGGDGDEDDALADALRARDIPTARVPENGKAALAYAERWGYALVASPTASGARFVRVADGKRKTFSLDARDLADDETKSALGAFAAGHDSVATEEQR